MIKYFLGEIMTNCYLILCLLCSSVFETQKQIQIKYRRNKITNSNYKLYKNGLDDDIFSYMKLSPPTYEYILLIEELYDSDYPIILKDIFSKFINYIDNINLDYCIRNLNSIKIKEVYEIEEKIYRFLFDEKALGCYYPYSNRIELYSKKPHVLSHEFLHMASTASWNTNLCGFHLSTKLKDKNIQEIGVGLNEGYTELLNSRIFYNNEKPKSYQKNVRIVKLLECFFEDYKDMEQAYFNNDLNKVYEKICRYASRDEFFLILNELDLYAKASNSIMDIKRFLKLEFKIYEIVKRSNDEKFIDKFEKIFYEDKLIKYITEKGIKINEIESFQNQYQKTKTRL